MRPPHHALVFYASGRGITDDMKALFVEPFGFLVKAYTADQLETAVASLTKPKR